MELALKTDFDEDLQIGNSPESFLKFLDSQRELFHSQIDELQRVVVTQCQLTGVNPLSQEMAAGALSIKIGKRPRDLINPKAVKYMQEVFSIKDAISKKETREISSQFGVTGTQVRDFFNSQRSRVRKLVRLSRERAIRANAHKKSQDAAALCFDSAVPIDMVPLNAIGLEPVCLNSVGLGPAPLNATETNLVPLNSVDPNCIPVNSIAPNTVPTNTDCSHSVPLNSIGPSSVEEASSCSTQDDTLPSLDDRDKHFVDNIFGMLQKEETFNGQAKLMEWILQIQNPSVLNWFLVKGGVMILATWLSQAADEEQTSVLVVTLKVLCHLPLHKALPEHMSAVLQSVNRLRFYRKSDISNRSRVLLSKWSKMFARTQAMKKPNGTKSSTDAQELILKRSIDEIMSDELWQSNIVKPDDALVLSSESSDNIRKLESSQPLKLLPASTDDMGRKHVLGISSSYGRERRKVQIVEQPGQKTAGRNLQAIKTAPVSQSRPMSADDIQKAKMRALYMQSKYRKTSSPSTASNGPKLEGLNKPSSTPPYNLSPVSKAPLQPENEEHKKLVTIPLKNEEHKELVVCPAMNEECKELVACPPMDEERKEHDFPPLKKEEHKELVTLSCKNGKHMELVTLPRQLESPLDPKQKIESPLPLEELCRKVQIPWKTPPEVKLNDQWSVGTGQNSKEVDFQKNRNRREMETIYWTVQEIPLNPKEPWDLEMDYDDTLTPDIPIEQPIDVDADAAAAAAAAAATAAAETQVSQNENVNTVVPPAHSLPNVGGGVAAEPDLELLAVLLKNPELVFALTTGQASNLSSEETVRLLDVIKKAGSALPGNVNGLGGNVDKVEVSLPSPTPPSSNPGTSGWRPEAVRNPFSQHSSTGSGVAYSDPAVSTITSSSVRPHNQAIDIRIPQQHANLRLLQQQAPAAMPKYSLPQATTMTPEERQPSLFLSPYQSHHSSNTSTLQRHASEMPLTMKTLPINNHPLQNFSPAAGSSLRVETTNRSIPPPSISFNLTTLERRAASLQTPTLLPTPAQVQVQPQPPYITESPMTYSTRTSAGSLGPVPDSWRARQGVASNSYVQTNHDRYEPSYVGSVRPQMPPGPPWERNEYRGHEGFESWSPENSPGRSPGYIQGRNYPGPRMVGWEYRPPDNRSRPGNSSGYQDQNRGGNRRWH